MLRATTQLFPRIPARDDDPSFIVLTETKFSFRCIPVWDRYSPPRTRVEEKKAHVITQAGLGVAHGPEIVKYVAQFSTTSVNIVTFFEPACVITGCLPT